MIRLQSEYVTLLSCPCQHERSSGGVVPPAHGAEADADCSTKMFLAEMFLAEMFLAEMFLADRQGALDQELTLARDPRSAREPMRRVEMRVEMRGDGNDSAVVSDFSAVMIRFRGSPTTRGASKATVDDAVHDSRFRRDAIRPLVDGVGRGGRLDIRLDIRLVGDAPPGPPVRAMTALGATNPAAGDVPPALRRGRLGGVTHWGEDVMITGGCFCGAIRYGIDDGAHPAGNCHCTMCRRTSAAAFVSWLIVPAEQFRFTQGEPAVLQSSTAGTRRFCSACGTPLTCVNADHPEIVDVTIGSLDEPERFPPQAAVFLDTALSWAHREVPEWTPEWTPGESA